MLHSREKLKGDLFHQRS